MHMIGLARLGRDAEVRYTANGTAVANLSLAFNYGLKDDDGNRPSQWIEAAMFGERAEKLLRYLTKGLLIMVSLDDPHVETFEKRDGTQGVKLSARVASLEFTGKAPDGADARPTAQPSKREQAARSITDLEDDIPF